MTSSGASSGANTVIVAGFNATEVLDGLKEIKSAIDQVSQSATSGSSALGSYQQIMQAIAASALSAASAISSVGNAMQSLGSGGLQFTNAGFSPNLLPPMQSNGTPLLGPGGSLPLMLAAPTAQGFSISSSPLTAPGFSSPGNNFPAIGAGPNGPLLLGSGYSTYIPNFTSGTPGASGLYPGNQLLLGPGYMPNFNQTQAVGPYLEGETIYGGRMPPSAAGPSVLSSSTGGYSSVATKMSAAERMAAGNAASDMSIADADAMSMGLYGASGSGSSGSGSSGGSSRKNMMGALGGFYARYLLYRGAFDLGDKFFTNASETQSEIAQLAFIEDQPINSDIINQQYEFAKNAGLASATSIPDSLGAYVDSYKLTKNVSESQAMTRAANQLGIITKTDPATTQPELASIYKAFGGGQAGTAAVSAMPNMISAASRVLDMSPTELEQAVSRGFPVAAQTGIFHPGKTPTQDDLSAYMALVGQLSQSSDLASTSVQSTLRLFFSDLESPSKERSVAKQGWNISGMSGMQVLADLQDINSGAGYIDGGKFNKTGPDGAPEGSQSGHKEALELISAIAGPRSGFSLSELLDSSKELSKTFTEISAAARSGTAGGQLTNLQLDQTIGGQWKTLEAQLSALTSNPNNPLIQGAANGLGILNQGLSGLNGAINLGAVSSALIGNKYLAPYLSDSGAQYDLEHAPLLGGIYSATIGAITAQTKPQEITNLEQHLTQLLHDPNTSLAEAQSLAQTYNQIAALTGAKPIAIKPNPPAPLPRTSASSPRRLRTTSATTLWGYEGGSMMQGFEPGPGAFEPDHPGIDIGLPGGTPVKLPQGGRYLNDPSSPYRSEFQLANGNYEVLLHLQNAIHYKNNQYVPAGTVIGQVDPTVHYPSDKYTVKEYGGATGGYYVSEGSHVHIADYTNAQNAQYDQNAGAINPTALLNGALLSGPPAPISTTPKPADMSPAHVAEIISGGKDTALGSKTAALIASTANQSKTSDLALLSYLRSYLGNSGNIATAEENNPSAVALMLSQFSAHTGGFTGMTKSSATSLLTSEFKATQTGANAKEIGAEVAKAIAAMTSWGAFTGSANGSAYSVIPQGSVNSTKSTADALNDPNTLTNQLLQANVDAQVASTDAINRSGSFNSPQGYQLPFYEGYAAHLNTHPSPGSATGVAARNNNSSRGAPARNHVP